MVEKLLEPNGQVASSWVLPSGAALAEDKNLFLSGSNQHKLQVTRRGYPIALFALAQVAKMGSANSLPLNEILILSFS